MAFPAAASRLEATGAPMALSPTETDLPGQCGDDEGTMTNKTPADRFRTLRLCGAFVGLAIALGACTTATEVVTASVPEDYRLRHPIAIHEGDRSVVVFVGHGRGGLSASQRAGGGGRIAGGSGVARGCRRAGARDRGPPLSSR